MAPRTPLVLGLMVCIALPPNAMALQTASFQKRSGFAPAAPVEEVRTSPLLVRSEPQSPPQARTEAVPRGTLAGVKLSVTKSTTEEPLMRTLDRISYPKIQTEEPLMRPLANAKLSGSNLGNDFIYDAEARKDKNGNPVVYKLPAEDGGGEEEIAGFTTKYNPKELNLLKHTAPEERKDVIRGLIDKKTANAKVWAKDPVVAGLLQDTIFHRGDGGASNIVRLGLGLVSGKDTTPLKPHEIEAFNKLDPLDAINAVTKGRMKYENEIIGVRPKLAKGLQNRFDNARKYFASKYLESNT